MKTLKNTITLAFLYSAGCGSLPVTPTYAVSFATQCGNESYADLLYDPAVSVNEVTEVSPLTKPDGSKGENLRVQKNSKDNEICVSSNGQKLVKLDMIVGELWRCHFENFDFYEAIEVACVPLSQDIAEETTACKARVSVVEYRKGSQPGSENADKYFSQPSGYHSYELFDSAVPAVGAQ